MWRAKNADSAQKKMIFNPKATFQSKAGREHRKYIANLEESVGTNGSIATEYQYEQNNHSNSLFIQECLEQIDRQDIS